MTEGRSGSTSLMEVLEGFENVAVPNKNFSCPDNELVHPKRVREHMEKFAALRGRPINSNDELIEAFFEFNNNFAYAGFKSMPDRHQNFDEFIFRKDIRFITLKRRDIASTIASFTMARATGSWRRHGEERQEQWRFDPARDGDWIRSNLLYILSSHERLDRVPDAISLHYEDLCDATYSCPELNEYFAHEIRLRNPKPPTSGGSYVANWEVFTAFVEDARRELRGAGRTVVARSHNGIRAMPEHRETIENATLIQDEPVGKQVNRDDLAKLETFCLFIGYPRSSGTLFGALLDAHPDAVIANELDVLQYVDTPMTREQLLSRLVNRAVEFAAEGCKKDSYTYQVANQWQGRYRTLKVIGDKKNGMVSVRLNGALTLAGKLQDLLGIPVKFVHVFRNPFDNIATLSQNESRSVPEAINLFFSMAASADKIRQEVGPGGMFELCQEDFIKSPQEQLRGLCGFFDLEATDDYLRDCAGIVFKSPHLSRSKVKWTRNQVDAITRLMAGFPHLKRYLENKDIPVVDPPQETAPVKKPQQTPSRRSATGQVVYAWELGMDLGHIMRFLPLALKLRDRGQSVAFAIRDLQHAESAIGQQGFPVYQAPIWMAMPKNLKNPPLNYAEIILRYGFMTATGLKGLVKAWRALFQALDAELIVADHSPSALLAAHTMDLKRVTIGHGFFSPPQISPTPNMRPWLKVSEDRLKAADALALANANRVIVDLGGKPLQMLSELFRVDAEFLCTFPELDHYPNRSGAHYWGPGFNIKEGKSIDWPRGDAPAVFAYLKTSYRDHEKVLSTLAGMDLRVIAYTPGLPPKIAQKYASEKMVISGEPVRLAGIRDQCNLAICHAGMGTVAAFLLAGTPLLLLPTQLEQLLVSRRVEALGAGLLINLQPENDRQPGKTSAGRKTAAKKPEINYRSVIARLLQQDTFRDSARAFAKKYAKFHPAAQSSAMATALEKILIGAA
jgi:UDP:flavonoid glycosyltransferase YjiC (YdhE family)